MIQRHSSRDISHVCTWYAYYICTCGAHANFVLSCLVLRLTASFLRHSFVRECIDCNVVLHFMSPFQHVIMQQKQILSSLFSLPHVCNRTNERSQSVLLAVFVNDKCCYAKLGKKKQQQREVFYTKNQNIIIKSLAKLKAVQNSI